MNKEQGKARKPIISVVIPVYNVERFLQDCIDSLINQTFQEIEFIFVNDASTDNSLEILRANQRKYPTKIKIYDSKKNLKQGGARNIGVSLSSGCFIGFVDSDDMVSPTMYETLYREIVDKNCDVAFVQYANVPEKASMTTVNAVRNELIPLISWGSLLSFNGKELSVSDRTALLATPIGGTYCGLWKRELLLDNKVFFPEHLKYEDNYWISLVRCYIEKITFIQEIHYYYRENSTSTTHLKNDIHQFDRRKIELMLLDELKRRNLFERYYPAWEYTFITRYVFNSFSMYCDRFKEVPYNQIKQLVRDLKETFPHWRQNRFYRSRTTRTERIKNELIIYFPRLCAKYLSSRKQKK